MYDETRATFVNELLPYIMESSLSIGTLGLCIKLGSINPQFARVLTTSFEGVTPNIRLINVDFPTPVLPQTRTRIFGGSSIRGSSTCKVAALSFQKPRLRIESIFPIIFDLHFSSFSRSRKFLGPQITVADWSRN